MRQRRASLIWLAAPSRYLNWSPGRARLMLISLLALILAFSIQPNFPPPPAGAPAPVENKGSESDLALYETITDHLRHGDDYYLTTMRELRARPGYPLRPFVTFRLPGLALLQAWLPAAATLVLLWTLAAATAIAWGLQLADLLPAAPPRLVAGLLLAGGMIAFVQPALTASHEVWGALLVAWSLATWRRSSLMVTLSLALLAMLIRETAALYVLVMACFAVLNGRKREALGWATVLSVFAIVLWLHAMAVWRVTSPADTPSDGWSELNGLWFFAMTVKHATVLEAFPFVVAAPLIALALFGWTVPDHPLTLRMAGVLAIYCVLIAGFARLNNFYWGMMAAPLCLVGLVFVPDGLRDLWRAARDAPRRITVTRVIP